MAAITPAIGAGMYVEIRGNVLKGGSWKRNRKAGEIELPVSGLTPDSDANFEMPHATGFVKTTITISAPFDTATPYHAPPHEIRVGVQLAARFGMTANLLTPEVTYCVMETSDQNEATMAGKGEWECTLMPANDFDGNSPGYFTENT